MSNSSSINETQNLDDKQDDLEESEEISLRRLSPVKANLSLTWDDLSVFVKTKKFSIYRNITELKQVVHNGSGAICPSQLVALMGPSGSGKSTILSALAHRHQGGVVVHGEVKLNGKRIDKRLRNISGFMFQDDFFFKVLTVREHLMFMAKLKMDKILPNREKTARVEALLDSFGLRHVANCKIGGQAQQGEKAYLSGGERRRVSLATAMINLPKLIFADEPTTGLDSFNAHRVVKTLKSVSKNTGAPILCSIHQPIPETLALFDKIILMAEGHLMFTGTPKEAVDFYISCGFIEDKFMSHAEFMVKCIAPVQGSIVNTEKKIQDLSRKYFTSKYYENFKKEIDEIKIEASDSIYVNFHKPLWLRKLSILIQRSYIVELRSPDRQWLAIFQKLILAIISGLCFANISNKDQDGIQGIQGALFLLVTENTYAPMYSVMYAFPKEYPQFMTEYYNDSYPASAYYISKVVASIPGYIMESMAFSVVLYFMANLRNSLYAFFMTQLFAILCIVISSAFGMLFSIIFPNVPTAITYMVPVDYLMMITAGIFVRLGTLHWAIRWLKFCSWFYYIYESYTILQWEGISDIQCEQNRTEIPCLSNGKQVIGTYDFSTENMTRNIGVLWGMFLAIHICGMLLFVRKVKKHA